MKKIFLTTAFLLVGLAAMAQIQVATLTHEGVNKQFYSAKAFIQAASEAQEGDLITLSAGIYESANITKGVKIRGVGYDGEQISEIRGNIGLGSEDPTSVVDIEGVYVNGNVDFNGNQMALGNIRRCKFTNLYNRTTEQVNLLHSIITNEMIVQNTSKISCMNSIINHPQNGKYESAQLFLNYCVFIHRGGLMRGFTMMNSVLIHADNTNSNASSEYVYVQPSSQAENCVAIGYSKTGDTSNTFSKIAGKNYGYYENYTDVFATLTSDIDVGVYQPDNDYALSETAKTLFVDAEGGQIGIYGGSTPFSKQLSYAIFSSLQVDPQADGDQLGVKISIKNPE